jgi:hypothetical protein
MIVLDANILIRAILGRRVGQLLDRYAPHGLRFFAADVAFNDTQKYLPALLEKRGRPTRTFKDHSRTYELLSNQSIENCMLS